MNALIAKLKEMRDFGGAARTPGLTDAQIESESARHPELGEAILAAHAAHVDLRSTMGEFLRKSEAEQIVEAQADFVNFYPEDGVNPYVALAARGPWVVTLKGAVIYDAGGYGMLPFGHTPKAVLEALARPQVMANVMTLSLSQLRFGRMLKREIGRTRGGSPYPKFFCLNSGSEAVTLAARISDVNAKLMTDPGARYAGRTIK